MVGFVLQQSAFCTHGHSLFSPLFLLAALNSNHLLFPKPMYAVDHASFTVLLGIWNCFFLSKFVSYLIFHLVLNTLAPFQAKQTRRGGCYILARLAQGFPQKKVHYSLC